MPIRANRGAFSALEWFGYCASSKELAGLMAVAKCDTVDTFAEMAYNVVVVKTVHIAEEIKMQLRKYDGALRILLQKSIPYKKRRAVLKSNPLLVVILSRIVFRYFEDQKTIM